MAINETIQINKKYRVLIEKTDGLKRWNRYSFWTHASDVEFDDGTTLADRIGNIRGITDDENGIAGLAADVTLVKKIKNQLLKLITDLSSQINNLKNTINFRLGGEYNPIDGGLRFYKDADGIWVEWLEGTGADTVRKKLGNDEYNITKVIVTDDATEWWNPKEDGVFPPSGYNVVTPDTRFEDENGDSHYVALHSPDSTVPRISGLNFIKYLRWAGLEKTDKLYNTVYIHIDSISIQKYDSLDHTYPSTGSDSDRMWRDSSGAYYDLNSGSIKFNFGESTYQGGGNVVQMTILYK